MKLIYVLEGKKDLKLVHLYMYVLSAHTHTHILNKDSLSPFLLRLINVFGKGFFSKKGG